MILIDSSAWIEYYRPKGREDFKRLILAAISRDEAAINGIIEVEVLSFTRTQKEYRELASDFSSFHYLPLEKAVFARAAQMGFALRGKGATIPAVDLTIAACALESKSLLLHCDTHYDQIKRHFPLETMSPQPKKHS